MNAMYHVTRKAKNQAVRLASRVGGTCPLTLPLQRNMQESPLNSIPPLQRGLQVGTQPLQQGMQVTCPIPSSCLDVCRQHPAPAGRWAGCPPLSLQGGHSSWHRSGASQASAAGTDLSWQRMKGITLLLPFLPTRLTPALMSPGKNMKFDKHKFAAILITLATLLVHAFFCFYTFITEFFSSFENCL